MFADILVEIYWQALEILREMWPTIWYPKLNRQNEMLALIKWFDSLRYSMRQTYFYLISCKWGLEEVHSSLAEQKHSKWFESRGR